MVTLTKHIPSHITTAGYRVLTSYEGQPQTCYGCGDTDHMYQFCPKRREAKTLQSTSTGTTWAHVTTNSTPTQGDPDKGNMAEAPTYTPTEQTPITYTEDSVRAFEPPHIQMTLLPAVRAYQSHTGRTYRISISLRLPTGLMMNRPQIMQWDPMRDH
jgi:hypothetical protein